MATSMSASWWSGASHLVAIEFQGRQPYHVEFTKLRKYPQLCMKVTSPAPYYLYGHVHNGMGYSYQQHLGPLYLDLRTVPQGAGHMIWEYLSAGRFTPLRGNPHDKTREEYFKSIVQVHSVADKFSIEGLKSDSEKEIVRKAQEMGLVELVKLLEEANYRSDSFPEFSEYLEQRLVGSALDYGRGDSQRAFNELATQPSLSVAQMLLKTITEISNVGCRLGKQHPMPDEVCKRRSAETMAASEVLGWSEMKYPRTMWVKPRIEIAGASQSVGSRFFGPTAKQQDRSGMKDHLGQTKLRAAVPEPTFYSPSEPAFIPPSIFLPSLAYGRESNVTELPQTWGDAPRALRYNEPSATSRRAKTLSEMEMEWQMEIMRQEKKLRQPNHLVQQRMAKMGFEKPESQTEHEASSMNPLPSPSDTRVGSSSETARDTEKDSADEASEACDQPVTPMGSEINIPEHNGLPSFDQPLQPLQRSPDTLNDEPVEVQGAMDWDNVLPEYDYTPWTLAERCVEENTGTD
ncbi:hypothetical protein FGADI_10970 [Fusarium gaditjirri]|uniref:Uncharacterized protein n=1 Tax=Fusarium gaditjirri TaxID=282569 RepID=A0A8H4SWA3_9HYPO|nr:hypothetical protein FGADI_10970 [Fusarium gaditjirri]